MTQFKAQITRLTEDIQTRLNEATSAVDEATERELAVTLCLELVAVCDELRVYGRTVTGGMRREIDRAEALGIPVRFVAAEGN